MKIGIFGGAFNPVHNGHIKLATDFYNYLELDKLLFIPTCKPPHKSDADFADGTDRIKMLELATEDIEAFEVSDIEFSLSDKSYTYKTLIELKKEYPDDELYLIIGADQLMQFDRWYHYKDILSMVKLCTSARNDEEEKRVLTDKAKNLDGLDMNNFFLSPFDVLKVSSTDIREKIKSDIDVSDLIPEKVYKYISEKGLYSVR